MKILPLVTTTNDCIKTLDRLRMVLITSDVIAIIITNFSGFEDGMFYLQFGKRNSDNNGVTAPMKIKNKELKQGRWLRELLLYKPTFTCK